MILIPGFTEEEFNNIKIDILNNEYTKQKYIKITIDVDKESFSVNCYKDGLGMTPEQFYLAFVKILKFFKKEQKDQNKNTFTGEQPMSEETPKDQKEDPKFTLHPGIGSKLTQNPESTFTYEDHLKEEIISKERIKSMIEDLRTSLSYIFNKSERMKNDLDELHKTSGNLQEIISRLNTAIKEIIHE